MTADNSPCLNFEVIICSSDSHDFRLKSHLFGMKQAAQKAILHHGGVSVLLRLIDEDCPYMSPSRGQVSVING